MRGKGTFLLAIVLVAAPLAQAASLRATTASPILQNEKANADHLSRFEDQEMLARWVRLELMVPLSANSSHYYFHEVPSRNRYLRPWARLFVQRLSRQFHARFKKPLRVTSLVRTEEYQKALRRRNGNASPASGEKRSSHLTGAAIDFSKKGMTRAQITWMRRSLSTIMDRGHVFALEEFQQPVFHVLVHRSYDDYVAAKLKAGKR